MKIIVWCKWLDDIFLGTKPPDGIGGAEVQMALWSKYLAKNNHNVYTFAWRSRLFNKTFQGVKFLPVPWMRKIGVLFDQLKFAYIPLLKPDIILLRSSSDIANILKYKKKHKFRLIYMLAHDFDVIPKNAKAQHGTAWFDQLAQADLVIAQSRFQEETLKQSLPNIKSTIQPNIFDPIFDISTEEKKYDFVWVGTIKEIKRPNWFIQLAEMYPQYTFTMIGIGQDKALLSQVENSASQLANFTYQGYLPLNKTLQAIANSRILINTSEFEGFPNVFLQAWYFNMPVIASVNPNDVFNHQSVGFFTETFDELVQKASLIMEDKTVFDEMALGVKNYFSHTHDPQRAYDKVAKYFESN